MSTELPKPPPVDTGSDTGGQQTAGDRATYVAQMEDKAWAWLRSKSLADRKKLLEYIRAKGYYSDTPVSNDALQNEDVARLRNFLIYADVAGMSIPQAQDSLAKIKDVPLVAPRPTTPAADLDSVFKSVMQQQLGRAPKADELEKFRAAYQKMEWGGNAPSVSSAAQQQITATNPGEEQATRFAGFASTFEQMLRGA